MYIDALETRYEQKKDDCALALLTRKSLQLVLPPEAKCVLA